MKIHRLLRPWLLALALVAGIAVEGLAMPDVNRSDSAPTSPAAPPAADFTLRFPHPETHRVEVEARYPTGGADTLDLMMAVWTPGSYMVREYSRQVETLDAATPDGDPLPVEKTRKNRWRVKAAEAGAALPETVVVRYVLYAREMTVRTNFVDAGFAILNGAPTFIVPLAGEAPAPGPYRVDLELPDAWPRAFSALPREGGGETGAFLAADYDTLVDSPLYAGDPVVQSFTVERQPDGGGAGEAEILLVHEGGGEVWDYERSRRDVESIVRTQRDLWGGFPVDRYLFLNLITESGGGLEHKDSTVLMTSRWDARTEEGWRDWLGLVSHELFHVWNGKRLRPLALGPFDYENEVYTPSLWFVEGITSYYDDLLVHRAGLSTRAQFLESLGGIVESVQTTPGRRLQPLEESSFDAWIKLYRRDENSPNRGISYYRKGALVAWLLDVRLRRASDGETTLDDLLRTAYDRWSGARGYTGEDLLGLVEELGGEDTARWLETTLASTDELDFSPALDWLGLELVEKDDLENGTGNGTGAALRQANRDEGSDETPVGEKGEKDAEDEAPAAWLGAGTEVREGRLVVTQVRRGTPAWAAGLNVEDELLAVDEYRVPPRDLDERLKRYRPGDESTLLVARRERLLRLPVTFGQEPDKKWYPRPADDATAEQEARRQRWLSGGR